MQIVFWAMPIFIVMILIEWLLTRDHDRKIYHLKDSAASILMGVGSVVITFGLKFMALGIFYLVYQFRIFDIPHTAWWAWVVLIPAEDLCYYWYHRTGHQVRLLWAGHVNHHSSRKYNLSTALRQSWTTPLFSWIFWVPLPLLGFNPLMVVIAQSVSLSYQFWIHTEMVDRMGPFGWVFNTPSHHRVHHGSNPKYLDRNHGGILIIWDRMFGTFEPETHRPDYGLTRNIDSYNLFVVAFHEWRDIAKDLRGAKTWRGRLGYLFAPPGWREDGTGKTSRMLREEAIQAEQASEAGVQPTEPESEALSSRAPAT